jgi:hypothetical protein
MFSLRTHIWILVGFFAATIGIAIAGNVLQAMGVGPVPPRFQMAVKIGFFLLFLGIGFSAIPVMVKLVLAGHVAIGNASRAPIQALARWQNIVIWAMWGLSAAGLVVALPTMIRSGFFDAADAETQGGGSLLVAAPGMTFADMLAQSSLKPEGPGNGGVPYSGAAAFDFRIAGPGTLFANCQYYFLSARDDDPARIKTITVGIVSAPLPRLALEVADAALAKRLVGEGWLAGQSLGGEGGRFWRKDGLLLRLSAERSDDPKPGEDPATAGLWMPFIDVWLEKGYPGIRSLLFPGQ